MRTRGLDIGAMVSHVRFAPYWRDRIRVVHMRRRNLARAAALLVLVAFAGRGDHLPEELHATGKVETKLAGLSITREGLNVSDAIKLYGAPTGRNVAARNPAWIGYRWIFGDAILEVSTADGKITDVYVEGTAKGAVARTGAGLMLGDGLAKLEAIYGPKFLD